MDQRIADAPYPWRERFQGFASLLYQSDDRDDDWLLNESGWDGPSAAAALIGLDTDRKLNLFHGASRYRVPGQAVLTFLESLHYVCVSLRVILGFSVSSSRRTSPSTTREAGNRRGDPSSSRSCGARGTPASCSTEPIFATATSSTSRFAGGCSSWHFCLAVARRSSGPGPPAPCVLRSRSARPRPEFSGFAFRAAAHNASRPSKVHRERREP
eukprot:s7784_g1.t2